MESSIETFATNLGFIEGPVWDPASGNIALVSISHGCVYTLDANGRLTNTVATGGGPNGLVLDGDTLLVAQNGGIFGASSVAVPGVQRVARGAATYLFEGGFDAPNDLAFGPDGLLYVTDPRSERAILEPIPGRLLVCDPRSGEVRVGAADRTCPNGLAFTADGRHLLLALTQARRVERFRCEAGALSSLGTFCDLTNGRTDGLALDEAGRLWVCTPGTGGVELFDADGSFIRRIEVGAGSMTTNLCFGGADGRDLFVTAAGWGTVLRLRSDIPGQPLFPGPTEEDAHA